MQPLSSQGETTPKLHTYLVKMFETFRNHEEALLKRYPKPWPELPEAFVCARELYEMLAGWLTRGYVSDVGENKDKFLHFATIEIYFNGFLNMASVKFKLHGCAATREFFQCSDEKSTGPEAKWLKSLKDRMNRVCFLRDQESGVEQDNSAIPRTNS